MTLSTLWHFHEARKVAIQQLQDGQLTEAELITVGRAQSVPRWVIVGYKSIVERPNDDTISDDEAGAIAGHDYRAIHHLWTIRHKLAVSRDTLDGEFIEREILSKFEAELDALREVELEHRTEEDIERDRREAEERRIIEEEEQAAAERAETERMEEARREALEKLAEEERLKEEQSRLREEMGSVRYEQRLRLGEELSAIKTKITTCLQKSELAVRNLEEIRTECGKCPKCSRRRLMAGKETSAVQGDVAALGKEVAQAAKEEETMRAQEENRGQPVPTASDDVQPGHSVKPYASWPHERHIRP